MKITIQLLCLLVSFLFGFFINKLIRFHSKVLKKASSISKLLISFLLSYIFVISYIDIIYFINNGNFHLYFIIFMIVGIIIGSKSKTKLFKTENIGKLMKNYPNREFIFQYGASEYHRMQRLDKNVANFSLLYDTSGGAGKLTKNWRAPLFEKHPQGYAGGLSPENVVQNLDKISKVAGSRTDIWIDAEGKLKTPGTKTFDINRAKQYINAALNWQKTK